MNLKNDCQEICTSKEVDTLGDFENFMKKDSELCPIHC